MPRELIEVIHGLDDDDDCWIKCNAIEYRDQDMRIALTLLINYDESLTQNWEIECTDVRETHGIFSGEGMELFADHPLLWRYHKDWASVSFHGKPRDIDALIGALWRVHSEMVQDSIPFTKFLNHGSLPELFRGGYGQLANGPLPLIERYVEVLHTHEVACGISEPRAPLRLMNDTWIPESGSTKLLEIGNGYVVAEGFRSMRLISST